MILTRPFRHRWSTFDSQIMHLLAMKPRYYILAYASLIYPSHHSESLTRSNGVGGEDVTVTGIDNCTFRLVKGKTARKRRGTYSVLHRNNFPQAVPSSIWGQGQVLLQKSCAHDFYLRTHNGPVCYPSVKKEQPNPPWQNPRDTCVSCRWAQVFGMGRGSSLTLFPLEE